MQFINYILRVHSFQQLFIWASTLFRRFLQTYICLDINPETLGVATIEVQFSQQFSLIIFFIIELTEGILLAI